MVWKRFEESVARKGPFVINAKQKVLDAYTDVSARQFN
jgi:hypothetical protein